MPTSHAADALLDPDGHLYVFGYGSLIWRPGFAHASAHPALLRGFHRRFCIWSRIYRGSPEAPGLVLGLDRGGACRGARLPGAGPARPAAVLDYLDARENIGDEVVYARRLLPVRLLDSGRTVRAVAYVVDRATAHYCRPAAEEAAAGHRPRHRPGRGEPRLPAEHRVASAGDGGAGCRAGPHRGAAAAAAG